MNVAKKERACRACVRCAKAMRRRRCVVAMALLVLVSSCRDEVAEVAVTPVVVHFADLDEATQARLRAEIEADVRAKIEAEVRAECESSLNEPVVKPMHDTIAALLVWAAVR